MPGRTRAVVAQRSHPTTGSSTPTPWFVRTASGSSPPTALPALPETETYQLWGVYGDGDVISLGVIGNRPDIEPFSALGDIDALVITREQAGGVVSSTTGAVLVGELS